MRPDYYEMNWYAERHRAFLEAIEPILAIKGRVYAMTIPRLLVYPDGHREVYYNFTPEQQRILDQCDEHIAYIKEQAYKQPFPWSPLGDH